MFNFRPIHVRKQFPLLIVPYPGEKKKRKLMIIFLSKSENFEKPDFDPIFDLLTANHPKHFLETSFFDQFIPFKNAKQTNEFIFV